MTNPCIITKTTTTGTEAAIRATPPANTDDGRVITDRRRLLLRPETETLAAEAAEMSTSMTIDVVEEEEEWRRREMEAGEERPRIIEEANAVAATIGEDLRRMTRIRGTRRETRRIAAAAREKVGTIVCTETEELETTMIMAEIKRPMTGSA